MIMIIYFLCVCVKGFFTSQLTLTEMTGKFLLPSSSTLFKIWQKEASHTKGITYSCHIISCSFQKTMYTRFVKFYLFK